MLPFDRWRRVRTRSSASESVLVPLGGRVVAVDTSTLLARVLDTPNDVVRFWFDTASETRYVEDADGLHVVDAIGTETLSWASAVYSGDPMATGFRVTRRGRNVSVTLGTENVVRIQYPDELLFRRVAGGQRRTTDHAPADNESWVVLHRAFEESDEGSTDTSSMGIYRIGPDGLLGGGLVSPDTAALTGNADNELMGPLAFLHNDAPSGLPLKVKRVGTDLTQSLAVAGPDGRLTELVPSARTQTLLIAYPSAEALALDQLAFDFDGTAYSLESLSRDNRNTFLGIFSVA